MSFSHAGAKDRLKGYVFLFSAAILWGNAFIFQKNVSQNIDAFSFNFLRFFVAIPSLYLLFLLPNQLFLPESRKQLAKNWHSSPWIIGTGAGVFMFLGISLQQLGLSYTTVGKSGFLTSLAIVFVPLFGFFFGQRCRSEMWVGVALTLLGVYLLGNTEGSSAESRFNLGDTMTLISAVAWAAQVLWLGFLGRYANVLQIAIVQVAVVTMLSLLMVGFNTQYHLPSWQVIWQARYAILYTGVLSAAVAFTLQILGQRYLPTSNASLVMSSEALFATLSGIIFLHEEITILGILGCFSILLGIVFAQLQGKIFIRKHQ